MLDQKNRMLYNGKAGFTCYLLVVSLHTIFHDHGVGVMLHSQKRKRIETLVNLVSW